jgi:hypothetical protein
MNYQRAALPGRLCLSDPVLIIDEGATIEYRISGGANGGVLATALDAAADEFNDFTEHILPCLLAINDLGDANNLSLAALAAWALVTFNIVDVGAALAVAAGPFAPIIAMLLLTAAIYFLLQVYTRRRGVHLRQRGLACAWRGSS